MSKTPMWRRYLRFWGADPPADVDAEISFHLEELAKNYVAHGIPPEKARIEASRRFGSVARTRAECLAVEERSVKAAQRRGLADALWHDALDAFRGLRKTPALTVGAALILALGIGLNTTVYSFNKAILFPDVPIGDSSRVVRLWLQNMARGVFITPLSEGEFGDLAGANRSFEAVAAYAVQPATLTGGAEAERISVMRATPNFFALLQVSPAQGRIFTSADAAGHEDSVAILSYRTWQNRLAGDPDVIGRDIQLDGRRHAIVGVMPEEFWFESREIAAWLPLAAPRGGGARDTRTLRTIGRLREDVDLQTAQADVQALGQRLARDHPRTNAGWDVVVTALLPLGPGEKVFFALVITLTGLLLAAACAHIANLLLARGMERRGEIAVRVALGAGRGRILRQLFAESVALAIVGAACSLLVALPAIGQLRAILGPRTPFLSDLSLDAGALTVTGGLAIVASVLFGFVPALRLSAVTAGDAIKQPSSGPTAGRRRRPLASLLIGFEVTVATLALVITVLFVRASQNVLALPLGFTPDGVFTFRIDVAEYKYGQPEDAARVLTAIHERLQRLPSIRAAGAGVRLPLNYGAGLPVDAIAIDDRPEIPAEQAPWAIKSIVTPGYFEALGIGRVEGRLFEPRDSATAPTVAIVSRSLASAYWPNRDAVGRRLKLADGTQPWLTIVGVVEDVRPVDPRSPQVRQLYLPFDQQPVRALTYFAAASDDPMKRLNEVRQAVREVDAELPVLDLGTLTGAIDDVLEGPRLSQQIVQVTAVSAVLLALTGVYSVVAFACARRRREVAIRVALGGRRAGIVAMLLRQAFRPALVGVGIGLVLAGLVGNAIAVMLYEVNPIDPLTYALTAASLTAAAAAASCFPAIRATRVNAALALRAE
jgi:predicted permease